jgi:hypothetical protein
MKVIKNLTGMLYGYNVRQTKDGKYHGYRGNVSVTKPCDTYEEVIQILTF